MISVVFYGTGKFAAAILKTIARNGNFKILAVITQSDKTAGRDNKIRQSPVKLLADELALKTYQPEKLKGFEAPELSEADLAVVAEYGLIIPGSLLRLPRRGTVNLHASILPKYRGASPIQTAIYNGDAVTGVTLMQVDEKMDHGPIISSVQTAVQNDELFKSVYDRLSVMASELFVRDAASYINQKITPTAQPDSEATYCKIIGREDGKIDFSRSAGEIFNQYRAFSDWPGIWSTFNGKRIKFGEILVANIGGLETGRTAVVGGRIYIGCGGDTSIEVKSVQIEGKKMMPAASFLNGERNFPGSKLD